MNDPRPGDITLFIGDTPHRLRLTLGALAEMEEALEADGLPALISRLTTPKTGDLLTVISILTKAGGMPVPVEILRVKEISLAEAITAITRLFRQATGTPETGAPGKPPAASGGTGAPPGSA